jgi:hypothetical protein
VIERAVIRNDAAVTIEDVRAEAATPPVREGKGRKLDPAVQQQWREFAQRFISEVRFDDPSQPPPRIGGLGWMRLPLPRGHWITLWRGTGRGEAGAFLNLNGSEGQSAYDELLEDRALIHEELTDAGLPAPTWERTDKGATVSLRWSAPLPWDAAAEERQRTELKAAANQLVNSLRPRLERSGSGNA